MTDKSSSPNALHHGEAMPGFQACPKTHPTYTASRSSMPIRSGSPNLAVTASLIPRKASDSSNLMTSASDALFFFTSESHFEQIL